MCRPLALLCVLGLGLGLGLTQAQMVLNPLETLRSNQIKSQEAHDRIKARCNDWASQAVQMWNETQLHLREMREEVLDQVPVLEPLVDRVESYTLMSRFMVDHMLKFLQLQQQEMEQLLEHNQVFVDFLEKQQMSCRAPPMKYQMR